MSNTHSASAAPDSLHENISAYAAGYLELAVGHHDSLTARIAAQTVSPRIVGNLRRQLHVQAAIVEAAMEAMRELMDCDSVAGADLDQARLADHRLQLLDEIRGLADRSVPV